MNTTTLLPALTILKRVVPELRKFNKKRQQYWHHKIVGARPFLTEHTDYKIETTSHGDRWLYTNNGVTKVAICASWVLMWSDLKCLSIESLNDRLSRYDTPLADITFSQHTTLPLHAGSDHELYRKLQIGVDLGSNPLYLYVPDIGPLIKPTSTQTTNPD